MDFPLAAILSLAIGLYVLIMVAVLLIYYCMRDRPQCSSSQCCVKTEGSQSCECCVAVSESCNCCKSPSLEACLKSCCPNRKHITCVDILLCHCCGSEGPSFWERCYDCGNEPPPRP